MVDYVEDIYKFYKVFEEGTKILVSSHVAAPEGKLKTVYQKYSSEQFECVALHPPTAGPGLVFFERTIRALSRAFTIFVL
ncbi:cyclin-B1-5-like [Panicum miliaceum]|uniref:Cyclin-B1-5-like n=1 Tax=Panicum miliaceum TaxID=4540 RepID=A0A3L6SYE5_PANMI|nr:cyclin-B1-5-like [Panicum miliaceum]